MMIERLQLFRKHSKSLPDRVLVFRDGVSEVCASLTLRPVFHS